MRDVCYDVEIESKVQTLEGDPSNTEPHALKMKPASISRPADSAIPAFAVLFLTLRSSILMAHPVPETSKMLTNNAKVRKTEI